MSRAARYVLMVMLMMASPTQALPSREVESPTPALPSREVESLTPALPSREGEIENDTIAVDTVGSEVAAEAKPKGFKKVTSFVRRVVEAFDDIDTTYVEPIDYNFTAILQGTTNFEFYGIGAPGYVRRISFAQHPDLRVGPYLGWKWICLGYTFDVLHLGSSKKSGQRFEFSIYTSMVGLDFIKRSTGADFFIRSVNGMGDEAKRFEGQDCNYINTNLIGLNAYYNFNHRRFSSPAVFSQSKIQRRSAGSWQVGATFTIHDVNFDYSALPTEMMAETEKENEYASLERIKYYNFGINGGYAYNFVPARGWCLSMSLMPSIGYMRASTSTVVLHEEEVGDDPYADQPFMQKMDEIFRRRGCINIGGTGRLGFIYNSGRWYVAAFGVVHNYNYRRNTFRFNNTFGTLNLCGGFYFQRKKHRD